MGVGDRLGHPRFKQRDAVAGGAQGLSYLLNRCVCHRQQLFVIALPARLSVAPIRGSVRVGLPLSVGLVRLDRAVGLLRNPSRLDGVAHRFLIAATMPSIGSDAPLFAHTCQVRTRVMRIFSAEVTLRVRGAEHTLFHPKSRKDP